MEEVPVHIDIERMEKKLAGPRFMVPNGLTVEQIAEFFDTMVKVAAYEREQCAAICDALAFRECAAAIRERADAIRKGA